MTNHLRDERPVYACRLEGDALPDLLCLSDERVAEVGGDYSQWFEGFPDSNAMRDAFTKAKCRSQSRRVH